MSISIILIAYHGDQWITECIRSLSKASETRLHLVLVDNSGNSILDDLDFGAFSVELLKTPEPLGFAEANNYALVNASRLGEYILFLNQDTISPDGWIDFCVGALSGHPDRGAASPLIRNYDETDWDPSFLNCLSQEQQQLLHDDFALSSDIWFNVDNVPAPALLVKKSVLLRSGPFDPLYGSYYEDYDLCLRIRNLGFRVGFSTRSMIRHYSGSTTDTHGKELRRMRQIIRNRVIYSARSGQISRLAVIFKYFAVSLPRNIIRGLLKRPGSQPPIVTLKAAKDILHLSGRLISGEKDQYLWERYLDEIGWSRLS